MVRTKGAGIVSGKVMRGVTTLVLVMSGSAALTQSTDPLAPLPQQPAMSARAPAARPAVPIVTSRPTAQTYPRSANPAPGFDGYKSRLAWLASSAGVRPATIAAVVPHLRLNQRAIRLDRAQPGQVSNPNASPPFAPYRRRHVTAELIRRGAAKYRAHYSRLSAIE